MNPPSPENFFMVLGCLALLSTLAYGAVRLWRMFFPHKDSENEPVTRKEFEARRKEFEARLLVMQSKSDEFRSKLSEELASTREGLSRIEEAVRQQGINFLNMIESKMRADSETHRSIERRLSGIEEHLRK